MNEIQNEPQVVVELKAADKKSRLAKPRLTLIGPTDIVDVWRLVEHSLRDGGQVYPDTTEDSAEHIRSHLFVYLQQPQFCGLLARIGRRPVGAILGHLASRPYGKPSRYAFVWGFWVEPTCRKQRIGHALWEAYMAQLKKLNIFHWEAHAHEHLVVALQRETGVPVKRLLSVIGGRT